MLNPKEQKVFELLCLYGLKQTAALYALQYDRQLYYEYILLLRVKRAKMLNKCMWDA